MRGQPSRCLLHAAVASRGHNCCAACCTSTRWPARAARREVSPCRWWRSLSSPSPASWGESCVTWDCRPVHPPWRRRDPHHSRVWISASPCRKRVASQTASKTKKVSLRLHRPQSSDRLREIPWRGKRGRARDALKVRILGLTSHHVTAMPRQTTCQRSLPRSLREKFASADPTTVDSGAAATFFDPRSHQFTP